MRSKLGAAIVVLTMLTVTVPLTAANHLSVGATDTIGNQARESPAPNAVRSVVGTDVGADDTPYGVGTKAPDQCYRPNDEVSVGEATGAATARGFCGQLYYNEQVDDPSLPHVSPPDQDFPGSEHVGTFDVVRTWHVSSLFGPDFFLPECLPLCESTGQDALWQGIHTVGEAAGLTEGPGAADGGQDGRDQAWFAGFEHAPPLTFAQRNTGIWDMDGWTLPAPIAERFVAFVEKPGGATFTEDDLDDLVDSLRGNKLNVETTPQICGYTPDRNFQGTGTQSFCELPFLFVESDDSVADVTDRPYDSYDDPCDSPTYVCGATTGDYWIAESAGLVAAFAGRYQGDHTRWHHVIAPNPDECPNTEPGFDFGGDGADWPYIAHDLDVYTTPQDLSAAPDVVSTEQPQRYAETLAGNLFPLPGLPGPAQDVADQAEDALTPVTRGESIEPNNADPIVGLEENSRQAIVESGAADACTKLISDESLADPWVNILDATVDANRQASYRDPVVDTRTPPELATDTEHIGLYGDDEGQDASNDATPSLYSTEGKAGVFTDKDDDGRYEQVTGPSDSASTFGAGVYGQKNIQAKGAYPMLWDMHASVENGQAVIDTDESCDFTGDQNFTEVMRDAGYGPNTGLAQAIYLKEPTVFTNVRPVPHDGPGTAGPGSDDPQTVPYTDGNNIYLLLNDAARNLWDGDAGSSNGFALDDQVDTLVSSLRSHVVTNYGAEASSLDVVQPGDELGLDSDFLSQCGESTGGFASQLSFLHDCSLDCSGDTIATLYTFEVLSDPLGGGDIPALVIEGNDFLFGETQHTWIDVDPFDGDADRNDDAENPPPSP